MPPRLKLVLGLAFLLRAALAFAAWLADSQAFYAKDTGSYLQPAIEFVSTGSFTSNGMPELFRTPGYPLLLSVGVWLGQVELVTIALQILLGCATVYFVFLLACELFGDVLPATLSALAFSLEPLSIISSSRLLSDALFTALLAAALLCLIRFVKQEQVTLLWLATALMVAAVYVRPIGYFLPLILALLLLSGAIVKKRRGHFLKILAFAVVSFALLGVWHLRNKLQTGYTGFSTAMEYNLYFHQVAALRARQEQLPFYQVMDELGFYSREKYLSQNPEQRQWALAQQYEFMRTEGVKATMRHPMAAANIYLHGLVITAFDPGASEYLRLFGLYPQSGKALNRVVSEGIVATALNLVTTRPLLSALAGAMGVWLLAYYLLAFIGLRAGAVRYNLPLQLLLATCLYLIMLSGGTVAASRFRLPVMMVVCILAGQGLSIASSYILLWKDQFASGLRIGEVNLTRHL